MARWLLPALLLVSCHSVAGSPASPAVPPAAPTAAPPDLPLRAEVARELPRIKFGLVAVLERGDKRAAVTWPAIRDGKILDNDIIGWVYVRDGEGWKLAQGNIGLSHRGGRETMEQALGGAPEHIVSRCGLSKKELATHLERWPRDFATARARGDDDGAIHAYEEWARAFSLETTAYDNMLPQLLIHRAEDKEKVQFTWTCDENACQAQATSRKGPETASFPLQRCGDGWVLVPPPR